MTSTSHPQDRPRPLEAPRRRALVAGYVVTAEVRRGEHTAVLQAHDREGSYVALKLGLTPAGEERVDRETSLLSLLARNVAPELVGTGRDMGWRYGATSWSHGAESRVAAAELRGAGDRMRLAELGCRIAWRYAALHARGVLHGQVHPRHVLVDIDWSVGLIDFSLGAWAEDVSRPAGRLNPLSAPEHAELALREEPLPLTAASEQYSVAALLYLLMTGRLYAPLRLKRRLLPLDIAANCPVPFADHGLEAWPALEAVLHRGLAKDPMQRFPCMGEFARALEAVARKGARMGGNARTGVLPVRTPLVALHESFVDVTRSADAIRSLTAPTCSINFGAAGVAFALTRLAKITGDAEAFEGAERWLDFAERHSADADAFDDGDELRRETVGPISPYHNVSGVAAARAFLSDATGNRPRHQAALDDFCAAVEDPCRNLDLTLGRSAVLLFAAFLYTGAAPDCPGAHRLAAYGDSLCAGIWRDLPSGALPYYGIAHGYAGIAYATLVWSKIREVAPPPATADVLDMLVSVAEPCERGVHWPLTPPHGVGADQYWPGWCHGNAGYVFLWNLASAVYGDESFAQLAERAAWLTDYTDGVTSLCCGAAGQAYAALNQYKGSGEQKWLSQASNVAVRAARNGTLAGDATTALSLYKGHAGLALLAVDLESPQGAAMPLFELET